MRGQNFIKYCGFFLLLIFLVVGCNSNLFKAHKFKLFVFNDPERKCELFINGKSISEYPYDSGGMYADDYRIYDFDEVTAMIKLSGNTVDEKVIKSGSYIINLSKTHSLHFFEISYGRECSPCKYGKLDDVGITQLSENQGVLAFDFNESPPKEITGRRVGDLRDRQFFKLIAKEK